MIVPKWFDLGLEPAILSASPLEFDIVKNILFTLVITFLLATVFSLVSLIVIVPLVALIRSGLLTSDPVSVALDLVRGTMDRHWEVWPVVVVQLGLVLGAMIALLVFLGKVLATFAELNSYFRLLYRVSFFFVLFLPIVVIGLYMFFPLPLGPLLILVMLGALAVVAGLTVVFRKVVPETRTNPNRRQLFILEKRP